MSLTGTFSKRRKLRISCGYRTRNCTLLARRKPLNTAGEFETELCSKDRQCTARFVVVDEKARPILSRQTSELFSILKIEKNSVSEENLLREFEGIFVGGKLKDFQAKLHCPKVETPTIWTNGEN